MSAAPLLPRDRLVFALDVKDRGEADRLIALLSPHIGVLKIGLELFVGEGPDLVRAAMARGLPVFLDLKLHDIPETVERAVSRAVDLGVRFLTIHASGGPKMIERAVARTRGTATEIVAVTVLTSLDASDLAATGVAADPATHARTLARCAREAGATAFVCSPHEARALRDALGAEVTLITPGVRPAGDATGDQKRVATPRDALAAGATYVVVGRPIRDAADPRAAADAIVRELTGGAS
ncbi:MAG: orotidine-5'-phosphate decarboxylase [Polyangiaceae bacterium]